jgi:hypothetical protein
MRSIFERLKYVNLKPNPGKCCFGTMEITFLGHVFNWQGLKPSPTKVHVVSKFPTPLLITNVQAFLKLQ